jgi:NAD(P)-dependent dehydrogenase (short-subunit alcohol dehydrogenase family)
MASEPGVTMFAPDALAGKVALVTGASSGLGRHFAQLLARHGATVVLAARRVDALTALAAELGAAGAGAHAVALDVRDHASVLRAVAESVARAGRIDILINNAGVAVTKPALQTGEDDWRSVIDTNLDGAFRVARAVAEAMTGGKHGGAIVNIASILGLRVAKQLPAYIAAKAGLLRLTEALALEWAAQRIRVNALAPGYIETELNRDFLRSAAGESLGKRVALRRFGVPEDLDGPLLLLASDAGRYMTGATITVDGGHSLAWL